MILQLFLLAKKEIIMNSFDIHIDLGEYINVENVKQKRNIY